MPAAWTLPRRAVGSRICSTNSNPPPGTLICSHPHGPAMLQAPRVHRASCLKISPTRHARGVGLVPATAPPKLPRLLWKPVGGEHSVASSEGNCRESHKERKFHTLG